MLEERFEELGKRIGLPNSLDIFKDLSKRHQGRPYHGLTHVEDCINELDLVKSFAENPNQIEYSLFFHDSIYDTKSKTNEEDSANLAFYTALNSVGFEFAYGSLKLIMATKHASIPQSIDGKLICDIDLSILGKEREVFERYDSNIRKEYSWVPEDDYKIGRSQVLDFFISRNSIYSTNLFKEKYEVQARENIRRVLDNLF